MESAKNPRICYFFIHLTNKLYNLAFLLLTGYFTAILEVNVNYFINFYTL